MLKFFLLIIDCLLHYKFIICSHISKSRNKKVQSFHEGDTTHVFLGYLGNEDTEDRVKILEKLQSDKPGNSGSTCASLQGCFQWSVCLCDLILTGIWSTYSHCKKSNLEELLFWVYISARKHDLLRTDGGICWSVSSIDFQYRVPFNFWCII